MTITTISSRAFNQDVSRAKKAAKMGPVFISDRGRPAHVLLSAEEYFRITRSQRSITDQLAMPGADEFELEIPQIRELPRPADFD